MNSACSIFAIVVVAVLHCVPQCKSDTFDIGNNGYNDEHEDKSNDYSMLCKEIRPQHSVDIEQIMGVWYGSEIIKHTQDIPGVFHINSCVMIRISDVTQEMQLSMRNHNYNSYIRASGTFQQQQQQHPVQQQQQQQAQHRPTEQLSTPWSTKYLRLLWSEKDDNLEYTFNYTEYSPGLWTSVEEQRGSLVALNKYNQFRGNVQVVKAVHDHIVLTFCGTDEKSSVYTVVLSRQKEGLSSEELRSIRNLLSRRGLPTETIHKVCSSAAAAFSASAALLVLSTLYLAILRLKWEWA